MASGKRPLPLCPTIEKVLPAPETPKEKSRPDLAGLAGPTFVEQTLDHGLDHLVEDVLVRGAFFEDFRKAEGFFRVVLDDHERIADPRDEVLGGDLRAARLHPTEDFQQRLGVGDAALQLALRDQLVELRELLEAFHPANHEFKLFLSF